jgi:hypothetical protein
MVYLHDVIRVRASSNRSSVICDDVLDNIASEQAERTYLLLRGSPWHDAASR